MNALNNKDVLILHIASYLHAIEHIASNANQTPQQCMDSFVRMHLEEQEHCHLFGYIGMCDVCYVQKYLDLAESLLDLNKLDQYKKLWT